MSGCRPPQRAVEQLQSIKSDGVVNLWLSWLASPPTAKVIRTDPLCLNIVCTAGEAQQLSASLVFAMPPAYPAAAALQVHVTSTGLPRTVVDGLSKLVQEQAAAAQVCKASRTLANFDTSASGSLYWQFVAGEATALPCRMVVAALRCYPACI